MQITTLSKNSSNHPECLVLFAKKGGKLLPSATVIDKACGNAISQAIKSSRFQGEAQESFTINAAISDRIGQVVVIGTGDTQKAPIDDWRLAGIEAGTILDKAGTTEAGVLFEDVKLKEHDVAEAFMEGFYLAMYRFEQFLTDQKKHQKQCFKQLVLMLSNNNSKEVKKAIKDVEGLMTGVATTRDLVNLPPNYANPDLMAKTAKELKKEGISVQILGERELQKLGMGMLLAVGQGADQESRLIVMKYNGAGKSPYKAVVGKGVMFDTGGYDIKPAAGMLHMKADMGGAGAVMGMMQALARRKSKVNVIGVCGCVMNMISGRAFLPSDVLTSYKGLTVEVGNTDAEGRLVLGDALAYIIDKEKPAEIIDIATLTGAVMMSLGGVYAGVFSEHEHMAEGLKKSGEHTGERVWQLPVSAKYGKMLKSKVADMNNMADSPWGGASTAAAFLQKFVGETPWAHLDIAGVAMTEKIGGNIPVSGSNGFGVRLLVNYLENSK
jgi:leucyl aminopeptidase